MDNKTKTQKEKYQGKSTINRKIYKCSHRDFIKYKSRSPNKYVKDQ